MLKTVVLLNIFVETVIYFFRIFFNKEKVQKLKVNLIEIEIFCNIINVFIATLFFILVQYINICVL